MTLPPDTCPYMSRPCLPSCRTAWFVPAVAAQRVRSLHENDGIGHGRFVWMRTVGDAALGIPAPMLAAVPSIMRAGSLPEPEASSVRCLKNPLDTI